MTKKWQSLIIIVAVIIVSVLVFKAGIFNRLSDQFEDQLFLKRSADPHIVIVAIDNESLNDIGSWPWPRQIFAKALNNLGEAQAIGIDVNFAEPSRLGSTDDQDLAEALKNISNKVILPIELGSNYKLVTEPLPTFKNQSEQGFVNVPLSADGTAREATISRGDYKSFDYLLASKTASLKEGPDTFRIAYRGGPSTYLTFPFTDVAEGKVPPNIFKDNVVLIGVTAQDLHDTLQTPFGLLSGVEVHANIIQTLKEGRYFRSIPDYLAYLLFILITAATFYAVRRFKSLIILSIVFLIGLGLLYAISAYLFTQYIIIPTIHILFSLILSVVVAVTYEYLTESKEKKFIRKSFQYYLPADVVSELVKNPDRLALGGEARELTVLFSDIRGFTTLSETLSPHDLTSVLNEYLSIMSDLIMDEKGLVDKYIGDAIMAFWGAPAENSHHAEAACRGAKAMLHALPEFNRKMKEKNWPTLAIGIGLNSGTMVVGNMGSKKRFNYTVMGDEVNLASRLEGLTKYYKAGCLVSESTKKEAEGADGLFFRPLDRVLVKGKLEPRRLYELLNQSLSADLEKYYLEGLDYYEKGNWQKAISSFQEGLKISADGPTEVFLERSREFLKNPPANWNGVYEFKVK